MDQTPDNQNLIIQYIIVGIFFLLLFIWIVWKSVRSWRRMRRGDAPPTCGACSSSGSCPNVYRKAGGRGRKS